MSEYCEWHLTNKEDVDPDYEYTKVVYGMACSEATFYTEGLSEVPNIVKFCCRCGRPIHIKEGMVNTYAE